ncbi:hypothetical protein JOM56_004456, partial [Amanita muscaria]
ITLDNASSNDTLCETVEMQHQLRKLSPWVAKENQIPCLEHAVNLANVAVMGHVTKLAVAETTSAIWEYDPTLPNNRILGDGLDVVSVLRTLNVKVRDS